MFRKNNKSVAIKKNNHKSIINNDLIQSKEKHSRNPSFHEDHISLKVNNIRKWVESNEENDKSMKFDEFKQENVSLMKNYKLSSALKTNSAFLSCYNSFGSEFTKLNRVRNSSDYTENHIIHTNAVDEEFKSPKDSYFILDNNKKIYEKIINLGISRLKQKYSEENEKYRSYDEGMNKKIKVTLVNPKKIDHKSVKDKGNCM